LEQAWRDKERHHRGSAWYLLENIDISVEMMRKLLLFSGMFLPRKTVGVCRWRRRLFFPSQEEGPDWLGQE
jgi:hypothetical protein